MPKNDVTSNRGHGNSIALRLFYKNPFAQSEFDKYAEEEQRFTQKELYGAQCVEIKCGLKNSCSVNITFINGLLIIKTGSDIDILLSGHSPAYGIHIETRGGCAIVSGPLLNLPVGMYIKSNRTVIDRPVSTTGFISCISNNDSDSWIKINSPVTADKVLINTPNLLFKSKLLANSGGIQCKNLKVVKGGKIHFEDKVTRSLNFDSLDPKTALDRYVYVKWKQKIEREIFNTSKSLLVAEKMVYGGALVLRYAILEIKEKVCFSPGCNIEFNNVDVIGRGIHFDIDSAVSGSDTKFYIKENFDVDGVCDIDGLAISSDTYAVAGLLWGGKNMHLEIRESASYHGIVGAAKTRISGKHLLASAIMGNEPLVYKTFVNGGIIGTSSLDIDVLTFVRAIGAYLYSPNMSLKGGVNVGLFSYIRRYNLVKNFIYDYSSLETDLLCMPEHLSDLMSPNKLLRVAEMIGSKFPILRGLISAYNAAAFIGPLCMSTLASILTSIRNDPNPLRQIENLASYGMSAVRHGYRTVQGGINNVINLAMGEWNASKLKEFVDILLQANGMRVYGNVIMSQLTNTLVFVNDIQNSLAPRPSLINDNPKLTESDEIKSYAKSIKKNLTVVKKTTPDDNKFSQENVSLLEAAKGVALNEVSRIVTAPVSLYNDVVGAAEAIGKINPVESANKIFESYSKQVNALVSAGQSVINSEPSMVPVQWPNMDEAFIWGTAKEAAKLLGPSVYSTSFVSDEGGLTITGNYIANTFFYRNRGIVLGLGTSVHSIMGSNNLGIIFSQQHLESTSRRNNSGILKSNEIRLDVDNNNEHGATEATTRMIFDIKNQYIAERAKFISTGQTFGHIHGNFISHGVQDLRNGHLKHEGTTELGNDSHLSFKKMTLDLDEDFIGNGRIHMSNSTMVGKKSAILKETSDTTLNNVTIQVEENFESHGKADISNSTISGKKSAVFTKTSDTHTDNVALNFSTISREDGSKFTIENVLSLNGVHVSSDLNSTLDGTPGSLLHINSKTLDERGAHNVGSGVFHVSEMDPESAHKLAYGLDEHQDKTYTNGVLVATERAEDLQYTPSSRTDDASATLLTGGSVVIPPVYQRAQGLRFSTYGEAERFIIGYDGYNLPEIPKFTKSIKQNFYEESTAACAAGTTLGGGAFLTGSGMGGIVAVASFATGLFTGHKARNAARKEQARINDELIRRAGIQRDIDQRLVAFDEKTDLAELNNSYNSSRINDLYQNLGVDNNSSVVHHNLTAQSMMQYQEDIKVLYNYRRLDVSRHHDEHDKRISKYISDRAQKIRESLGFNISAGASTNFGPTGYTVSGTYNTGFGGIKIHGSIPFYDKTYTSSLPYQNTIELPSSRQDRTHQMSGLPPTTYGRNDLPENDGWLNYNMPYQDFGLNDVKNSLHNAMNQLHYDDYLTSSRMQYAATSTTYDNRLTFASTDSGTMGFSSSNGGSNRLLYNIKNSLYDASEQCQNPIEMLLRQDHTYQILDDNSYLSSPGFRSGGPVFGDIDDVVPQARSNSIYPATQQSQYSPSAYGQLSNLNNNYPNQYAVREIDVDMLLAGAYGVGKGMALNSVIFAASNLKYIGPFIRGAGLLGAGVMAVQAAHVAADFEKDNFMFTEDFDDIMKNPFISDERKQTIWDESTERQLQARLEATKTKNLVDRFKDNPEIFGIGVGSFLTFSYVPGASNANPFMNLRIRVPFKEVPEKRHLEYMTKIVKATPGMEHVEIASGGIHAYENFAKAREMARIRANMSDDAVPYLSKLGPHKDKVYVGMASRDGTKVWRLDIDFDHKTDQLKDPHINWFYRCSERKKDRYSGKIYIENMTVDQYWEIINKFPRNTNYIG